MEDDVKGLDKKATIREVARVAGVSISTVSRALRRPELVSKKTIEMIQRISKELGYEFNRQASDFRKGRSNAIIVLVSDISHPFYSEFFKGVEEIARAEGFVVIIGEADGAGSGANYVSMMLSGKADGVILNTDYYPVGLTPNPANDSKFSSLAMVACSPLTGGNLPTVKIDNYESAKLAAEHLLKLGHKKLGQICGPLKDQVFRERTHGFSDKVAQAGFGDAESLVHMPDFSIESGRVAVAQLMMKTHRPTAIFSHNDEMAIGAMYELKKMGLRIPEDISIVGFDDMYYSQVVSPPLTTIRMPKRAWGRTACDLLISRIRGTATNSREIVLSTEFVIRESSGPCFS